MEVDTVILTQIDAKKISFREPMEADM